MAKRRKPKRQILAPAETRASDVLTSVWMLTVVTAFACECGAMASRWYLDVDPESLAALAMYQLLFFAALVIGLVSLVLVVAVLKTRQTAPPSGITVFALVVGAAPLVTRILQAVL